MVYARIRLRHVVLCRKVCLLLCFKALLGHHDSIDEVARKRCYYVSRHAHELKVIDQFVVFNVLIVEADRVDLECGNTADYEVECGSDDLYRDFLFADEEVVLKANSDYAYLPCDYHC